MKSLSLNQMEKIEGGANWSCIGGWAGLGFITVGAVAVTVANPALAAAVLLSGEGAVVGAGITAASLN